MYKVFVDMDGVISDLITEFCKLSYFYFGVPLSKNEITNYEIDKCTSLTREQVRYIFNTEGLFSNLKPIDNSIKYVEQLYNLDCFDIYIATMPINSYSAEEKIKWLEYYFPFIPLNKVIMLSDKSLLKGDIIIDDNPEFLCNFDGYSICFDAPYNRSNELFYDFRVKTWEECYDTLNEIAHKEFYGLQRWHS